MLINMTSADADDLAERAWTPSSPLSVVRPGDRVSDLAWWGSRQKREDFNSSRHRAALGLYQHLASHATVGVLPPRCFPAMFEFNDGERRRPDKGWIKAAVGNRIITGVHATELLFEVKTS